MHTPFVRTPFVPGGEFAIPAVKRDELEGQDEEAPDYGDEDELLDAEVESRIIGTDEDL